MCRGSWDADANDDDGRIAYNGIESGWRKVATEGDRREQEGRY